jgi:ABC-type nitrate/sulfonate/bicarbonate transport system substrate-binding protein
MSNQINIGGVTEHFNLPWNLAVEQNKFSEAGVDLNWKFFPGGTGVMTEALRTGELDLAILLTEGFISAAAKGLKAKIVKEYITSPLGFTIVSLKNMLSVSSVQARI